MTESTFVEAVLLEVPDFKEILAYYAEYDSMELAVYSAAGVLGDKLSTLKLAGDEASVDQIERIAWLAERAELSDIGKVHDSMGTDFLPALVQDGPIPRRIYEHFGPALRRLVEEGRFPREV